jgi:hypothetical protein
MATLVKIRGLERDKSAVADGSTTGGSYRGFRVRSGLGSAYAGGTKATLSTSLTGNNNDLTYTAVSGGTWGNAIKVEYLDPSAASAALAVSVNYTASTGAPTISVSLATNSGSTITSTAASIKTAVDAHPLASQLVTVANKTSNDGTGVVTAMSATALATGANSGVAEPLYFKVANKYNVVVDVDDPKTQRQLKRNAGRYVSLGAV